MSTINGTDEEFIGLIAKMSATNAKEVSAIDALMQLDLDYIVTEHIITNF